MSAKRHPWCSTMHHPCQLVHQQWKQTVRAWHDAGRSQRAIARELGIDRRKIKHIIDHPT